eukprot:g10833.t1
MAGWMDRRGPTIDFAWQRRWVVLHEGKLETYLGQERLTRRFMQDRPGQLRASFGEDCQERKAMTRLRPQSSMKAFKVAPLGDSELHRAERPNGFVLDLEPEAAHRPMVYFDPLDSESLSQWTQAINESLQDLEQAMMRDCRIAASRLVRDVVVRCCNSPERITNRRVTKLLLRGFLETGRDVGSVKKQFPSDIEARSREVSAVREDRQQAAKAVRRNLPVGALWEKACVGGLQP